MNKQTMQNIKYRIAIYLLSIIILCSISILKASAIKSNPVYFNTLNGDTELSYSSVLDITEDSKGYIWIGTNRGLNRYNGNRVEHISLFPKDSIERMDNSIKKLLSTENNKLFIGTNWGLFCLDQNNNRVEELRVGEESYKNIESIIAIDETRILVSSGKGRYIIDSETLSEKEVNYLPSGNHHAVTLNREIISLSSNRVNFSSISNDNSREYKLDTFRGGPDVNPIPISAYVDRTGTIWVGTRSHGLYRFNRSKDIFEHIYIDDGDCGLSIKYILTISEDEYGRIWIGTENGLFIYNHSRTDYQHLKQSYSSANSISDNAIYKVFRDRDNIMWIGSYFGGVVYANVNERRFQKLLADNSNHSIRGKAVRDIFEDSDHNLWIASEDRAVTIYSREGDRYRYLNEENSRLCGNNVHSICEDNSGQIWLGLHLDGLYRVDRETLEVKRVDQFVDEIHKREASQASFTHITDLGGDSLFVVKDHYKACLINATTNEIEPLFPDELDYSRFNGTTTDSAGDIWISTSNRGLFRYRRSNHTLESFNRDNTPELNSNNYTRGAIDKDGNIWFSSESKYLIKFNISSDRFETYPLGEEFNDRHIYTTLPDSRGDIWISTSSGLYSYNIDRRLSEAFTKSDGLPSNQFNYHARYIDREETLYFGTIDGLCYFNPSDINREVHDERDPMVRFTNLKVVGDKITPSINGILKSTLDNSSTLNLKRGESSLNIGFSIIDYINNRRSKYSCIYYLENYEKEWNRVDNREVEANYINLPAGNYTFKVKLIDNNSNIIDSRDIAINIAPHFMLCNSMLILYIILSALVIYIIYRRAKRVKIEQLVKEREILERENSKILNRHKLNFFTYISHEFKTPLTIILAIFNSVERVSLESRDKIQLNIKDANIISRNIKRLQFLVDQLMEFRHTESEHNRVSYIKSDIVAFNKRIYELFTPLFQQKSINHTFTSNTPLFSTPYDSDKVDKIVSNLLSNAFKHTPNGGDVSQSIDINIEKKIITIETTNSGTTLSKEQIDTIFEPYYSSRANSGSSSNSGIGLAIIKGLVNILNGDIAVTSSSDRETTFRVTLPLVKGSDIEEQVTPATVSSEKLIEDIRHEDGVEIAGFDIEMSPDKRREEILVVEDSKELREILRDRLSKTYRVRAAKDGVDALNRLKEHSYDIIISDIMMDNMDGYELCRRVKQCSDTNHIPVILISSQSTTEGRLEGFKSGADIYIEKPFVFEELLLRVENLLTSKKTMRGYLDNLVDIDIDAPMNNRDERFIKDLTTIVVENLEQTSLSAEFLAKEMGVSRTLIHNKLKSISDIKTSEFINRIKIEEAKRVLLKSDMTISEIAYHTGFSTPSYFSKVFKKGTNLSPAEFRIKMRSSI